MHSVRQHQLLFQSEKAAECRHFVDFAKSGSALIGWVLITVQYGETIRNNCCILTRLSETACSVWQMFPNSAFFNSNSKISVVTMSTLTLGQAWRLGCFRANWRRCRNKMRIWNIKKKSCSPINFFFKSCYAVPSTWYPALILFFSFYIWKERILPQSFTALLQSTHYTVSPAG